MFRFWDGKEVLYCEDCGAAGLDVGICGEQLGPVGTSYICQDIICEDCRVGGSDDAEGREEAMIREDLYLAAKAKATERGISFGKFLEQALELTLKIESLTEDQFEELFYNGKSPKDGFTMSTGEVSQGAGRMGYLATSSGSMRPNSHLGGFDDAEGRKKEVSLYKEGQGGSGCVP